MARSRWTRDGLRDPLMPEFGYRDPNYRSPYLHHAAPAPEDISAAFRDDLIPAPSYVDAGDTVHVITTLEAR